MTETKENLTQDGVRFCYKVTLKGGQFSYFNSGMLMDIALTNESRLYDIEKIELRPQFEDPED